MSIPFRRQTVAALLLMSCVAVFLSCRDTLEPWWEARRTGPPPIAQSSCAAAMGSRHAGDVAGTWTAAAGPHRLVDEVRIPESLVIEPGTVVCGAPGASLYIVSGARLIARGTPTQPILFTAMDTAAPWDGILSFPPERGCSPGGASSPPSQISTARIEHALVGIGGCATVLLDSSMIRQIRGSAFQSNGAIRNSVIDTAALDGGSAVDANRVSILVEHTVIRGSGGSGLDGGYSAEGLLQLGSVRIEGSAGVGLVGCCRKFGHESITILQPGSVRITGGASYPAILGPNAVRDGFPTPAAQDSLIGNAKDTLIVHNGLEDVTIGAALPWLVRPGIAAQACWSACDSNRAHR